MVLAGLNPIYDQITKIIKIIKIVENLRMSLGPGPLVPVVVHRLLAPLLEQHGDREMVSR